MLDCASVGIKSKTLSVDTGIGQVWWTGISKKAFADGVRAALDGYWNWQ
ncbi:hypothetical protein [Mycobacterium lepromatosis]|nr:hypothetical protein [Mycobacterium lepromatosis]